MINSYKICDLPEYVRVVEKLSSYNKLILYRGQCDDLPLIPSICRKEPNHDSTIDEKKMLQELQRRSTALIKNSPLDEWDWLVYAQHFGMKTRLLDWTSNAMIALWFACSNEQKYNQDSYVYVFANAEQYNVNKTESVSPFSIKKTQVLKPNLNNPRIIAQEGWFTAHCYSEKLKTFVDLKNHKEYHSAISMVTIPKEIKEKLMLTLSKIGINNQVVYPDIEGMCKHLNWEYNV